MTYQPTDEQMEPIWDAAQDSDEDAFEAALQELIRSAQASALRQFASTSTNQNFIRALHAEADHIEAEGVA